MGETAKKLRGNTQAADPEFRPPTVRPAVGAVPDWLDLSMIPPANLRSLAAWHRAIADSLDDKIARSEALQKASQRRKAERQIRKSKLESAGRHAARLIAGGQNQRIAARLAAGAEGLEPEAVESVLAQVKKEWDNAQIRQRDRRILYLFGLGISDKDIAGKVGLSKKRVNAIINAERKLAAETRRLAAAPAPGSLPAPKEPARPRRRSWRDSAKLYDAAE